MRKVLYLVSVFLVVVATVWAQGQVATVTSSSPFTLRAATVTPGQGVPMWPVLAGDTIKAGNAVTIVTFPDGSVITLEPGAEAMIEISPTGTPIVKLLSGSAHYSLKSISAVQLMAANRIVTPKDLVGVLTIGGSKKVPGGFWTAGHTALVIVGAGAAAGLGVGISQATSGGTPVSQSR
jgi:hypothetical protein